MFSILFLKFRENRILDEGQESAELSKRIELLKICLIICLILAISNITSS